MISEVWDNCLTPRLVKQSFALTGIYDPSVPYFVNKDAIDDSTFDPFKLREYKKIMATDASLPIASVAVQKDKSSEDKPIKIVKTKHQRNFYSSIVDFF